MADTTSALKTQANELTKSYSVYGASGITSFYLAPANAVAGTPCTRTDYAYDGSGNPIKMQEYNDVWNASYDI